jgi:hypothetical protein
MNNKALVVIHEFKFHDDMYILCDEKKCLIIKKPIYMPFFYYGQHTLQKLNLIFHLSQKYVVCLRHKT